MKGGREEGGEAAEIVPERGTPTPGKRLRHVWGTKKKSCALEPRVGKERERMELRGDKGPSVHGTVLCQ